MMSNKDSHDLLHDDPALVEDKQLSNHSRPLGETTEEHQSSEPLLSGLTEHSYPLTSLDEQNSGNIATPIQEGVMEADYFQNDVTNFDHDVVHIVTNFDDDIVHDVGNNSAEFSIEPLHPNHPEYNKPVETGENFSETEELAEKKIEVSMLHKVGPDFNSFDLVSSDMDQVEYQNQSDPEISKNDTTIVGSDKNTEMTKHEEKVVEFKTGMVCNDVPTALEILKTKYKLSDVQYHRPILTTWSCWNISDMVRGPHRESYYWRDNKRRRKEEVEETAVETKDETPEIKEQLLQEMLADIEMEEICQKIDVSHQEITLMLKKIIEHDDREKEREKLEISAVQTDPVDYQVKTNPEEEIAPKRRENAIRRLMRALRRRLARLGGGHHGGDKFSEPGTPGYNPDSVSNEGTLKRNKAKRHESGRSGKSSGRSTPQGETSSRYGSLKRFKLKRKGSGKITTESGQNLSVQASNENEKETVQVAESKLDNPATESSVHDVKLVENVHVSAQFTEPACGVEVKQLDNVLPAEGHPIVIVTQASSDTLELNGKVSKVFEITPVDEAVHLTFEDETQPETERSPTADSCKKLEMTIQTETPLMLESLPTNDIQGNENSDDSCMIQTMQSHMTCSLDPSSPASGCDDVQQPTEAFDMTDQWAEDNNTQNTSTISQIVNETQLPQTNTEVIDDTTPSIDFQTSNDANLGLNDTCITTLCAENSHREENYHFEEESPEICDTIHESCTEHITGNSENSEDCLNSSVVHPDDITHYDHVTSDTQIKCYSSVEDPEGVKDTVILSEETEAVNMSYNDNSESSIPYDTSNIDDEMHDVTTGEHIAEIQEHDVISNRYDVMIDDKVISPDESDSPERNYDEIAAKNVTLLPEDDLTIGKHGGAESEHHNVTGEHEVVRSETDSAMEEQTEFNALERSINITHCNGEREDLNGMILDTDTDHKHHDIDEEETFEYHNNSQPEMGGEVHNLQVDATYDNHLIDMNLDTKQSSDINNAIILSNTEVLEEKLAVSTGQNDFDQELVSNETVRKV